MRFSGGNSTRQLLLGLESDITAPSQLQYEIDDTYMRPATTLNRTKMKGLQLSDRLGRGE